MPLVAAPLTRGNARGPGVNPPGRRQEDDVNLIAHTLRSGGFDASEDGTNPESGQRPRHTEPTGDAAGLNGAPVDADGMRTPDGLAGRLDGPTVNAGGITEGDRSAYDPQPDGRRYAACGDGVVAPVAAWIGRRLAATMTNTLREAA